MTSLLFIQLVVSFVVGGCFITFLSLLAERTSENIAGIIMMFPSTIVLGFFFLGLATSAENVALIVPATLIPLGLGISSSAVYIYCSLFVSKYFTSKITQILATFLVTNMIWLVLASPFAIWRFKNFTLGTIGFFTLIIITHLILNQNGVSPISRPKYTKIQILIRAVFTGSIIATVVLLGKLLNPFWGGVFTMYPAAIIATLIIFHFYYEPRQLFYFMKKVPIGSLSVLVYAIVSMLLFPEYGIAIGTGLSCLTCLLVSFVLIKYQSRQQKVLK